MTANIRKQLVESAAFQLRENGNPLTTEAANACLENVVFGRFRWNDRAQGYYKGLTYVGLARLCNDVLLTARRQLSQSADRERLSQYRACRCGCGRKAEGKSWYAGAACRQRVSRRERAE